jgi:hypothetical protein
VNIAKLREFVTMKITGQITRAAIVGKAENTSDLPNSVANWPSRWAVNLSKR